VNAYSALTLKRIRVKNPRFLTDLSFFKFQTGPCCPYIDLGLLCCTFL